jgi:tRNA(Arg) A34 adenosine deaminase TadA
VLLDIAWGRALELAWQSFLAGTTPVGAVITGPEGDIVAEGRGRRYEQSDGAGGHLAYCHIAHAEINALAQLPPTRHYEDHILLTTLEPCCMCLGAAVQSTITRLYFAGRDPYAGAAQLTVDTPQARRRPLAISGPLTGPRGQFAELLHIRWLIEYGAAKPVLSAQQRGIPDSYARAAHPAAKSLFDRLRREAATVPQAMATADGLTVEA